MIKSLLIAVAAISLAARVASWQESHRWNKGHSRPHLGSRHKNRDHHSTKTENLDDIISSNQQEIKQERHTVCRTDDCFRIAGELWQSMNRSVDPCVDFYEYACGRWPERHPIPPTKKSWDPSSEIKTQVINHVRDILEEKNHPDEILPVKLARKFYKSCMNLDAIEEAGYHPIESMLVATGGWPMIMEEHEWNSQEFPWQYMEDYYVLHTRRFALFRFDVTLDRTMKKVTLGMGSPTLPTSSHIFFDRSILYDDGKYANYIKSVASTLAEVRDSDISQGNLDKDIEDLIEFEKKLQNSTFEDILAVAKSKINNVADLQEMYDRIAEHSDGVAKINWKKKLTHFYDGMGLTFDDSQEIRFIDLEYFGTLARVLKNTSPRTIVNFVQWSYISEFLQYTTEKMRRLQFELTNDELGIKEEEPRWKTCVQETQLKDSISYQFVKKYFNKNMKKDAEQMIDYIKKAMEKKISMVDWIDEVTKESMRQKIGSLKTYIGYPDWYDNKTRMNSLYSGLVIGRQWFDNALNMMKYSKKDEFKFVGKEVKTLVDERWPIDPIMVNAGYIPTSNLIAVPAADFFTPFYAEHRTDTLNWGAIGMIIAHEISHGFDPHGHHYDKNGDIFLWKHKTERKYEEKQECFVKQYDKYYRNVADVLNMTYEESGKGTLDENIADSLGQENIFSAYSMLKEHKTDPVIPGFEDLTNDHLFFLSFANLWCTATTPEFEEISNGDNHSTAKYRVIAPIQNSENFARVFKCPKGSPMNPETKCKIF